MRVVSDALKGVRGLERQQLLLLGALAGGHVIVHWYQQIFSLILPSIKADLGLSNIQVGSLATARQTITIASSLPSSYLADSFRRYVPVILAVSLAAFGISYFLLAAAHSYIWVIPAAAFTVVGSSLWHPAALASLSLRFPERRGMALSIHGVGASIGDSIAPLIVGAILLVAGWRVVTQYHLIPALVVGLILWKSLGRMYQQEAPRVAFGSYVKGLRAMITRSQVLGLVLSNSLAGMGRLSVMTFFPIYIRETLGYSTFVLGIYLTLLYVLGMFSAPVMGIASDRFGRKVVLVPATGAMGLLFLAIALAQGGVQLGVVIGLLGLFFYALVNIHHAAVMDVAGAEVQASTSAVMNLFSQPFTLASPILAGYLVEEFGIRASFWYAGATMLAAAVVLLPIRFLRHGNAGGAHQ